LKISHALLKMIDGDFDGDMMRQHVNIQATTTVAFETNDDAYRTMRLGLNALGMKDGGVKIGTRAFESYAVNQLGLAWRDSGAIHENAKALLQNIDSWMTTNLSS